MALFRRLSRLVRPLRRGISRLDITEPRRTHMKNDQNAAHLVNPEAAKPAGAQADTDTSSLRCYFKKVTKDGTETTWGWGVASDNSWFKMSGTWKTTPTTKNQKFFTDTSQSAMNTAAENALRYYKLVGYTLVGYFAATQGAGYDYPIVTSGVELYPDQ
jgi:hypothetical protein